MKQCTKCFEEKPLDAFYAHPKSRDRHSAHCKTCHRTRTNAYKQTEVGKRVSRNSHYRLKYGITYDEAEALWAAQGYACAICGTQEGLGNHEHFSVDHCHKSGKVRGLLCHGCNSALGLFKENVESLAKAIVYLEAHRHESSDEV